MHIHKQIQLPLIKTILCFICFDQRETHIRASNDRGSCICLCICIVCLMLVYVCIAIPKRVLYAIKIII
jgi:hypothetical protein